MSFIYPDFFSGGGNRRNVRNINPWFGVNPFDINVSNVFDPFNQIDRFMNQALGWTDTPRTRIRSRTGGQQRVQQSQKQQQQQLGGGIGIGGMSLGGGRIGSGSINLTAKMPQKYRICIDCSSCDPNNIRTEVQSVRGQDVLVVSIKDKRGKGAIKRSHVLPKGVKVEKMSVFITPKNHFVIEFPLMELPSSLDVDLVPNVFGTDKNKVCVIETKIPEFIDPMTVTVGRKGNELILRFEEKSEKPDTISRAFFYNRVTLPLNCDLTKIHCVQKKRWLTIMTPIITKVTGGFQNIPIHRKLRHRMIRKQEELKQQRSTQDSSKSQTGRQRLGPQMSQNIQSSSQNKQKTLQSGQKTTQSGLQNVSGSSATQKIKGQQQEQQQKQQRSTITDQQDMQGWQTVGGQKSKKKTIQQQIGGQHTIQQQQQQKQGSQIRRIGSDVLHNLFGGTQQQKQKKQQTWKQGGSSGSLDSNNIQEKSQTWKNKAKTNLGGSTAGFTTMPNKTLAGSSKTSGVDQSTTTKNQSEFQTRKSDQSGDNNRRSPTQDNKSNLRSSPTSPSSSK